MRFFLFLTVFVLMCQSFAHSEEKKEPIKVFDESDILRIQQNYVRIDSSTNPPIIRDTISIDGWTWMPSYRLGPWEASRDTVQYILSSHEIAGPMFDSAHTRITTWTIVGGIGMIFLGDFLGQTMTKQDPDFLIGGVSAVIVSYSVWRYFNAYSHAEQAIAIYNSDHKSDELYRRGYSIGFGFNPRGLGLTLNF